MLGLILLPFCKLHGLTITHNMGCLQILPLLIACFLIASIEFGDRCLRCYQMRGYDLEMIAVDDLVIF